MQIAINSSNEFFYSYFGVQFDQQKPNNPKDNQKNPSHTNFKEFFARYDRMKKDFRYFLSNKKRRGPVKSCM